MDKPISETFTTAMSDNELHGIIVLADLIQAPMDFSDETEILWKRPIEEVCARGFPQELHATVLHIESEAELQRVRGIVQRLKHAD